MERRTKNERLANAISGALENRRGCALVEGEQATILATIQREQPETETASAAPAAGLFDLVDYERTARDEGFEPDEIGGFESTARRAHSLGIMPNDVADAIDSGRIVYDFGSGRVLVDGQ